MVLYISQINTREYNLNINAFVSNIQFCLFIYKRLKQSLTSKLKNKRNPKWCYIIDISTWQENIHK